MRTAVLNGASAPSLLFLSLFALVPIAPAHGATMAVEACFSPQGRCSGQIGRELARARSEILVAVYAFTSEELAWALIQAKQRGVKVEVVLDAEFDAANNSSRGTLLQQHGIAVRRASGLKTGNPERGSGLMHQKFAVIDLRVVITGSYNWTVSADQFNEENVLIFRDAQPLAEDFRKEFLRLWEKKR